MSNEIQATANLAIANGSYVESAYQKVSVTQTTLGGNGGVAVISHSGDTTIDYGSVVTPGYIFFQNLDATNYIDIGVDGTTNAAIRLLAGEIAMFRVKPTVALKARANTADANLYFKLFQA